MDKEKEVTDAGPKDSVVLIAFGLAVISALYAIYHFILKPLF